MGLAEDHVDWQLKLLRPLLISYFNHGYKHGVEDSDCPGCEFNTGAIPKHVPYNGGEQWRRDGEKGWVSSEAGEQKKDDCNVSSLEDVQKAWKDREDWK